MPAPVSIGGFFISAGNATDTVALCLSLSGAKVTKRFENTKIYDKKVVSFGKRWRDDGSVAFVTDCKFYGAFGYDYYWEEGEMRGGGKSIVIGR